MRWRELLEQSRILPIHAIRCRMLRTDRSWTSPTVTSLNPSSLSDPSPPHCALGMEDTLRHPPGPACTLCGSVAVAQVAGCYLCAEHAIEAMQLAAGSAVEETATARM